MTGRRRAATQPAGTRQPANTRELMVCVGGPLDSHWYYADDWANLIALANNPRYHPAEVGAEANYHPTTASRDNPNPQWLPGRVWRWIEPKPTTTD